MKEYGILIAINNTCGPIRAMPPSSANCFNNIPGACPSLTNNNIDCRVIYSEDFENLSKSKKPSAWRIFLALDLRLEVDLAPEIRLF